MQLVTTSLKLKKTDYSQKYNKMYNSKLIINLNYQKGSVNLQRCNNALLAYSKLQFF